MRKLCSIWVLRLLTVDQKQRRVDNSERCLQMFQRNKKEILQKYATMDETGSHLSEQQQVKVVERDQNRKHQQARF